MSTLTATQLQQQYIAYFGRPGDPAGIKYWLAPASGISSAREFADKIYAQDEYKKTTIASKTTEEQVNSLYVNLFGRQADSAGLLYWTGEIQNGNLQLSNIAVNLIHAASNPVAGNETQAGLDATALSNKVSAAESYTAELEKSTSAILAYQAESISPWVSGTAFASGVTFIKTATATNAPTAADAASSVSSMVAASTAASVPASQSLKLTANTDALVGDGGNDTISAVLEKNGATGSTIAPGDSVDGKGGTDIFTISVAGDATSAYTVSALTLDNVEKLFLSNFDVNAGSTTVEAGLMTGLTTVGLSSSSETGDTIIKGLKNNVDAEMRNGSADLTVTYDGTYKATGTSDTQKLTLSGLTAGTFATNGIETLDINTELVKSTLEAATSDKLKTVNVTGDQDLTVNTALIWDGTTDGKTIDGTLDASTFTGKLSVGVGGSVSTVSVKGGTGNDTIKFADKLGSNDVVDGGAGTDTLTLTAATTAAPLTTEFTNVSNVETVAFDAAAVATEIDVSKLSAGVTTVQVDLKDGNDGNTTTDSTIKNLGSQTVVVKHSVADFSDTGTDDGVKLTISAASDTSADTVNVTLSAIGAGTNLGLMGLNVANYETVNISNKKSTGVSGNEVTTLTTSSAKSVAVTGDANLTITSIVGGAMTSFDASAMDGTLTATFSDADKITAKAATKNTTFNFGGTLNNDDTVVGGAGTADKVTATGWNGRTATTGKLNISAVETLDLATTGANTIDLSNVTGLKNLELDNFTQTITGFDLGTTIVSADNATSVKVTAADATGTADTLKLQSNLNTQTRTNTVEAKGIETLAITTNDSSSLSVHEVTYALAKFEGNTVTATQKSTAGNSNVQLGALHKNVTTVDTSGIKGTQKFDLTASTAATTSTLNGTDTITVTGSAKADTFTISKTGAKSHTVNGEGGTDVLTITVDGNFVDPLNLNVEDVTISVVAGNEDVDLAGNEFNDTTTAITLTGGNTLSSFKALTAGLKPGVKTFNASTFGGDLELQVDDDDFDDTLTITGGSSTKDSVTSTIATAGTDKPKTTGIETLKITSNDGTGGASVGVLDLSNTTGVTSIEATVGTADTLTIDKATTQSVKVVSATSTSTFEYKLSDQTGSSDAVTLELSDAATNIAAGAKLKTTDIENVTVKISTNNESISLADLSMTTAGATMSLAATGNKQLTVSALNTDVTTINASGMSEGGSFVQTGRSSTAAATYTGSAGNDTFQMKNDDDAIDGGAGTSDTLVVTKNLILGGIKVDLTKTGDQITTFNGNSNTAIQTGFENINLSNVTGTFGSEITAIKGGSIITGTPNTDVITLGSGADDVSLAGIVSATKADSISGFTTGSDDIGLDIANTSVSTLAGTNAVAAVDAATALKSGGNYDLNTNAGSASNAADIFIMKGGNAAEANLSAATDGTELFKYLGANSNPVTGVTVVASSKFYLAAEDAGNTYIFYAAEGNNDTVAVAADFALVATLNGTASTVATDYITTA